MMKKSCLHILAILLLSFTAPISFAGSENDVFGQTIQINTRFHSFVGKPSLLIIIRDIDHGQNIPYLFDINRGENFWVLFTYSRNYLISVSNLRVESYQARYNTFKRFETQNFCNLESNGRIIHGESMAITIEGDLTPNSDTYSCSVMRFPDTNFTIVNQNDP